MYAPAIRLCPFEQIGPLPGIGNVIAVRITVVLVEIVDHGNGQRAFGVGVAFKFDIERFTHNAAAALAADDERTTYVLLFTSGIGNRGSNAFCVLRKGFENRGHAYIAQRVTAQHLHRFVDHFGAFALQYIREFGVILQYGVIELGKHLAGLAIPVLKCRRDQAALFHPRVKPEAVEHFQRCRMYAAGARILFAESLFIKLLDHHRAHIVLRQIQGEGKSDGAGTNDDYRGACR